MNRLTPEQRVQIAEIVNQNNCSVRQTHRALLPFYGVQKRLLERLIRRTIDGFRTTFTVNNNVHYNFIFR